MLTIINKTNYENKIEYIQSQPVGFIHKQVTGYNPSRNRFETRVELIPDVLDYFPNSDYRDNELSQLIPAGVDLGGIKLLHNDSLLIGDDVQKAIDIISESGIDDIVEP